MKFAMYINRNIHFQLVPKLSTTIHYISTNKNSFLV